MRVIGNGPGAPGRSTGEEVETRFISQLTRRTVAIVLAGGRGTRLRQLTEVRAKPAVPFAGKFRIIDFTLSNCVNSGIRKIGIATQYKAHSLIRHVQRGWGFLDGRFEEFVQLLPAQQELDESQWYQGTADAVYQNLHFLRRHDPELVLVVAGDHVYKMDYGYMLASHARRRADMTVACIDVPVAQAHEFGVMAVDDDGRVTEFLEKPRHPPCIPGRPERALASMGVYVFNAKFLFEQLERDALTPGSGHDFGKDIIPYILPRHRVFAHSFTESCVRAGQEPPYWRDVGTVDAYWEANMEMTRVTPALDLYDRNWPIWTYERQEPPAKFVFDDAERRGSAVDSLISGGCIISGATVRRSLLFSSVKVHSWATVEDSVILPEVHIGRNAVLKRAIVDKRCHIPAGMAIGVNPQQDRQRFYVSANGVTLVTAEMVEKAARENR